MTTFEPSQQPERSVREDAPIATSDPFAETAPVSDRKAQDPKDNASHQVVEVRDVASHPYSEDLIGAFSAKERLDILGREDKVIAPSVERSSNPLENIDSASLYSQVLKTFQAMTTERGAPLTDTQRIGDLRFVISAIEQILDKESLDLKSLAAKDYPTLAAKLEDQWNKVDPTKFKDILKTYLSAKIELTNRGN